MKFASRYLESNLTQWIKCTYRELRSILGLLQKVSWVAKGDGKQYLFQQHGFPFHFSQSVANTNSKEQALATDQDRGKP